jgi:4'-phosphopantetheinyl transferase
MEIAKRYFSDDEVRALQALPSELRTTVFFDCWTKKEAYVKAIGDGMSLMLPTLTISYQGSDGFSVTARSEEMSGWSFESFSVEENYIASIALEGEPMELHYFKWAE